MQFWKGTNGVFANTWPLATFFKCFAHFEWFAEMHWMNWMHRMKPMDMSQCNAMGMRTKVHSHILPSPLGTEWHDFVVWLLHLSATLFPFVTLDFLQWLHQNLTCVQCLKQTISLKPWGRFESWLHVNWYWKISLREFYNALTFNTIVLSKRENIHPFKLIRIFNEFTRFYVS